MPDPDGRSLPCRGAPNRTHWNGTVTLSPLLSSLFAATIILGIAAPSAEAAGNAGAGRRKAMQCAACHGIDGIAKLPNAANIAGESVFYLEKQLKAFRSGERKDENMSVVARDLTDQDIADLAAWYASLEVTVVVPPR